MTGLFAIAAVLAAVNVAAVVFGAFVRRWRAARAVIQQTEAEGHECNERR